jgi:trans-o-hydroxybenzylidenepyruvate hydratase-aldolase
MLSSKDLHGIMAMMPAFTTDDGGAIGATQTVDVARLTSGVDKIIRDGATVVTTTGSFGEASNLLPEEFEVLARATVEAARGRVPVIIGCVAQHSREVVVKMRVAERGGADGVIVAVPYYFPSSVENAVNMFDEIAAMFPKLGILIYHNPTLHRITIPVSAFTAISKNKNIVGMKDSHRTPAAFLQLMEIVQGKISVFVQQDQYFAYRDLGAAGLWSIDIWMGPEPIVRLKQAVDDGDTETAREIVKDILKHREYARDLSWREMGHKLGICYAGYVDPGPLRPPFVKVPESVHEQLKRRAAHWRSLCEKYAPATA